MGVREAYVGEYASGKSECAINRAISLRGQGEQVTLVDLDLVEPFYTLRPLKEELEGLGLTIVAWNRREAPGPGEAGNILLPAARFALLQTGHVVLDVGCGAHGGRVLNLLEGYPHPDLRVYVVVNTARPLTATTAKIVEFVRTFDRVDGLINNSHLGDDTGLEVIRRGARIVGAAARVLRVPVVATAAEERFRDALGGRDRQGFPVLYLSRFMKKAYW